MHGINVYACDWLCLRETGSSDPLCYDNELGMVNYLPSHEGIYMVPAVYWQLRNKVVSVVATSCTKNLWNYLRLPLSIIIIISSVLKKTRQGSCGHSSKKYCGSAVSTNVPQPWSNQVNYWDRYRNENRCRWTALLFLIWWWYNSSGVNGEGSMIWLRIRKSTDRFVHQVMNW